MSFISNLKDEKRTRELGKGFCSIDELQQLRLKPEYRKATTNMMLSLEAIERAWRNIQRDPVLSEIAAMDPSEIGLVCCSILGELQCTKDFLMTWADAKMARPILFQNSLHNSTAGYVMIARGWKGPMLSLSGTLENPEQGELIADTLIATEQCRMVVLLYVDTKVNNLEEFTHHDQVVWNTASARILSGVAKN